MTFMPLASADDGARIMGRPKDTRGTALLHHFNMRNHVGAGRFLRRKANLVARLDVIEHCRILDLEHIVMGGMPRFKIAPWRMVIFFASLSTFPSPEVS